LLALLVAMVGCAPETRDVLKIDCAREPRNPLCLEQMDVASNDEIEPKPYCLDLPLDDDCFERCYGTPAMRFFKAEWQCQQRAQAPACQEVDVQDISRIRQDCAEKCRCYTL
jgi:hypothetical protein